ncbi:hypothetical protein [Synechococcus sp. MU1611]|uniref:hypothetical protein n=1 Tax=Synechococcus sp. MU1611 TaxID=2508345 RepID=UPI001CF81DAB|nr:hypothetical protein [Synechococcus sp. MU1611]MCB4411677.1 hypothetical protein [Synechococcus sp. MU1611]
MNINEAIEKASQAKSSADNWVGLICLFEFGVGILAAPFTMGVSLFALLAIPPTACLGACATNTKRTAELSEVQAQLLAEIYRR